MDEQGYDTIEDIVKMSKTSKKPFYLADGRVIHDGQIHKNEEACFKRIEAMNNAFIKMDTVVRFFTFGTRRLIPKGSIDAYKNRQNK